MATRTELLVAVGERYRQADRPQRSAILDEFVAITGYHRKHAIRLLASKKEAAARAARRPRCRYGPDARDALIALWEASDRICSKRLEPLIPVLLPALERHRQLAISDETRDLLLRISPATMDRLLTDVRLAARGGRRRRAGFSSAVRRAVPVRTFGDWNDPPPGYVEVDFVAHSGTSAAGSFVQTMVLTDIATGWTECVPVVVRSGELVIEALIAAAALFPFPLCGVDFDNDGAFMNELVVGWCRSQGLEVTRSRAYRKNDQAWVEQKNGAIVRRLVGYGRLEGLSAAKALGRLYAAARLHTNLFQPSFKLREKKRIGARVIKRYHAPAPPLARVLAHTAVEEGRKARLRQLHANADPVMLLAEIRAAQAELGERVDRRGTAPIREQPIVVDLERFAVSLKTAWRDGEQRPTHRRPYRRRKPVPKRASMLDAVRDQIRAWIDSEPGISALEVLSRLKAAQPETFTDKHLRTVQRAVKAWRGQQARRIIVESSIAMSAAVRDPLDTDRHSPPPPDPHPRGSPTWVHRCYGADGEGRTIAVGYDRWSPHAEAQRPQQVPRRRRRGHHLDCSDRDGLGELADRRSHSRRRAPSTAKARCRSDSLTRPTSPLA
jgi:hypothetical protein